MSRKLQALTMSLVVGVSLTLSALPSQAAPSPTPTPSPSVPEAATITTEAYTFNPASVSAQKSVKRAAAASGDVAPPDAATLPGLTRAESLSGPIAASTPEQEAALADQNADAGVTYEEPASPGSGKMSAARTKPEYDYIGFSECQKHDSKAGGKLGWTKNHYAWCQDLGVYVQEVENTNGTREVVGELTMLRMIRASTTRENRTMKIRENNYDVVACGTYADGVGIYAYMDCTGYPASKQCDMEGSAYKTLQTGDGLGVSFTMKSAPAAQPVRTRRASGFSSPSQTFTSTAWPKRSTGTPKAFDATLPHTSITAAPASSTE